MTDLGLTWGPWVDASGNGMRLGIAVTVTAGNDGAIDHGSAQAKFTVEFYTQNRNAYSNDTQSINYSGAIGGSVTYNNSQGTGQVKRDTKVYYYDYGPNEYGSGGVTKTFSGTVVGAVNGVKPSETRTPNVPDRPIASPAKTTNATAARISDAATQITWTNQATAGEPYGNVKVFRQVLPYGSFPGNGYAEVANLGGGATSYQDGVIANRKWQYYTQATNNAGNSGFDLTGAILTTPADPSSCSRTPSGPNQIINWANNVLYADHQTEVWRAQNGTYAHLATVGSGVTSYQDNNVPGSSRWKYCVRCVSTSGGLYSGFSNETSESELVVGGGTPSYTAPNPPTGLAPANNQVLPPIGITSLSWAHNPTDGTPQTRFLLRHREVGAGTWVNVDVTTATSAHTLAANTYGYSKSIEWQVATYGYLTSSPSPYSTLANWKTADPVPKKYPLYLDLDSGRVEASTVATTLVGQISMWAGSTAPGGWFLCQGQSLLRVDYPDLFSVISTTYGAADGTHFSLPNLQGRFVLGVSGGHGLGSVGGAETNALTSTAQMPEHSHSGWSGYDDPDHAHTEAPEVWINSQGGAFTTITGTYWQNTISVGGRGHVAGYGASARHVHGIGIGNAGQATPNGFSIMPPFQTINYMIRALPVGA